jgi:LuxR family maltose regulon positive regulatory protein
LRANGQLLEIRAEDLRFDDREAGAFFTLADIGGLSSGDIQRLSQHAEGWPAALRLAAILLPTREDRSGFARDFAGSNRQMADYMVTDVLAAQPEAVRTFLLRTCVLERLTAPLCDALTGAAGSGVTLRETSRAGLFIAPIDTAGEWYRYHQLFSEALRAELRITDPDMIPVLHGRASCWFEQNGDLESATEHAIRARDLERSSRLVIGQLQPFVAIGRIATIERWLGDLSWPQARQHPELAVGRAAAAGVGGDLEAAGRWLDVAAAGDRQTMTGAGVPLGFGVDLLCSLHALGNLRSALAAAQRALREAPAPAWRGAALTGLGQCQYLLGHTDDAAASLREALTLLPDDPYMLAQAAGYLSLADTDRGNPGQGERGARTVLELLDSRGLAHLGTMAACHLGLGAAMQARGRLGEAQAELNMAVELCKSATPSIWHAHALILFADVLHSLGETAGAVGALEQAEAILARLADPGAVPGFARELRERLATPARRAAASGEELTERELVVLRLAAAGLTQRETATQLYLSTNTVKTHLSRIYRKLGASSRPQAVERARELGMI